ncbi:hypothetical protein ACFFQF_12625 [Haladaptatus pallidirubidus]|uniref:hypothetical protein n=1 Tax=Haladaptatus pallidirubidus TaxID=1008152 RepID=UPI0035E55F2B
MSCGFQRFERTAGTIGVTFRSRRIRAAADRPRQPSLRVAANRSVSGVRLRVTRALRGSRQHSFSTERRFERY